MDQFSFHGTTKQSHSATTQHFKMTGGHDCDRIVVKQIPEGKKSVIEKKTGFKFPMEMESTWIIQRHANQNWIDTNIMQKS